MINDDNIVIVYLKNDLKFDDIIFEIRHYALKEYVEFSKQVMSEVVTAAGNLKRLFDNFYKKGRNIYSRIHGKFETDLLIHGLKSYHIKSCKMRETTESVIIVIGDFSIKKVNNMRKENITFEKIFKEIEQYLNEYKVNSSGEIVKK